MNAHNLLYNLTWRVQVYKPLVDLEFVSIPRFRTFTARLGTGDIKARERHIKDRHSF